MGDFNVSCVISGRSMGCSRVAVIPLQALDDLPTRYREGAYMFSNDGEQIIYRVVTLPIFGKLNGYGAVEDIERDKNVEVLEEYYGQSIENIVHSCTNGWRDSKHETPEGKPKLPTASCYAHYGIYKELTRVENTFDEWGRPMSVYYNADLHNTTLELCGFKFVGEVVREQNPYGQRYNKKYISDEFPGWIIYSDGRWTEHFKPNSDKQVSVYSVEDLDKRLIEEYGRGLSNVPHLKELSRYLIDYNNKLTKVKEREAMNNPLLAELYDMIMDSYWEMSYNSDQFSKNFTTIYRKHLTDPQIKTSFVELKNFNHQMFSCNKHYTPTFSGYQYGNAYAERMLHEVSLKFVNAEIAEREEDE